MRLRGNSAATTRAFAAQASVLGAARVTMGVSAALAKFVVTGNYQNASVRLDSICPMIEAIPFGEQESG
jgi:hypothetical protein